MQNQSLVINTQAGAALLGKKAYEPNPWRAPNQLVLKTMPSQVGIISKSVDCIDAVHTQKRAYLSTLSVEFGQIQGVLFSIESKPASVQLVMFSRLCGRINQKREYTGNSNDHARNVLMFAIVGKHSSTACNEYEVKEKSYFLVKPHMHAIPGDRVIDVQSCFVLGAVIAHGFITYFWGGCVGFLSGGTWVFTCPVSVIIESFLGENSNGVRALNITMGVLSLSALRKRATL